MNAKSGYEIEVSDVEYVRHGDKPLLARLFKPRGSGPFPIIVDLHGGAWYRGDRTNDTPINEPLARSGVVVAALDFRMPPEGAYPAAMADINYAIRWLKTKARELGSAPDRIGVMGIRATRRSRCRRARRPSTPASAA